jgi:Yippee zinc-binding/DNA-binding /Mis18, centromere assembly
MGAFTFIYCHVLIIFLNFICSNFKSLGKEHACVFYEDRRLLTGLHTVADIYCRDCHVLGWTYEWAYEETQKYKEGKFIFEKSKIVKENW